MSLPALASPPSAPAQGLRRSALLMRALGARASSVWSQLSSQEAEQLSQVMQSLPEDEDGEQNALSTFVQSMDQSAPAFASKPASVWDRLSEQDGRVIADLLQGESPQVIALIFSRLAPQSAANAVRALPRPLATEALKRMLSLGKIHPAALRALEHAVDTALSQTAAAAQSGGHEQVARIFDQMDSKSEANLLASLNTAEPGAGEKIRALMFTFEDLAKLDAASLQTILGSIDRVVLTLALKGASETVADAFFGNMTQRAGDLLREEMEATGPVRRSEIEAARAEIITVARSLVKRGDILVQTPDDELIE